ncbi:MAG: polymerase subunit epsilon [Microbacteriaceae bacterium]|nr:polymerase subunit epsilon [Microbacteriaceae bacterium]
MDSSDVTDEGLSEPRQAVFREVPLIDVPLAEVREVWVHPVRRRVRVRSVAVTSLEVPLDGLDELFAPEQHIGSVVATTADSVLIDTVTVVAAAVDTVVIDTLDLVVEIIQPPAWSHLLGVFDLETTGIDVTTSRIVSAHVGVIDAMGHSVEVHEWLADPGVEIPEGASAVHGISTERARAEGRPAIEVVSEILDALRGILGRGIPVTIFNAPYDLSLLAHEAARYGLQPLGSPLPIIDPLVIDKALDRYRKGKRTLEAAAIVYGVSLEDAHDAGADAVAAGRVAQAIARRYPIELGEDVLALHEQQVTWCADQAESFQDYMRRERDQHFSADGSWPERS